MSGVARDTFRPVAELFELSTAEGTVLVLDKRGRSAAEVAASVRELIEAAREHLSTAPGALASAEAVFSEWWQLGYDSWLGHLSPAWDLYLLTPARPLPLA